MDTFDWLAERVVTTPVGQVAVSLASHEDGAMSAVAWLLPVGRRVGYLFRQARQRRPQEEQFDPVLTGTAVRPLMETLLDQAGGLSPRAESVADRLVREGRLSAEDVADLLGWQWLLAELGQPRGLGELAVAGGLLDTRAAGELDAAVERREPGLASAPSFRPTAGSEAVAALA
jgi:hypothetical protein